MAVVKRLKRYQNKRSRQKGIALITAVLVTAVAIIIALKMTESGLLEIRRESNMDQSRRAHYLQLGLEDWSRDILREDQSHSQSDYNGEAWTQTLPPMPADQATVSGFLIDLDGRLDLNQLIVDDVENEVNIERLVRLLKQQNISAGLSDKILDWIDSDTEPRPYGAENSIYRSKGYMAANGPMNDITDLRLVDGVNADVYKRLSPYLTALPLAHKLNVNTASDEVLMALIEGVTPAIANQLSNSGRARYANIADFAEQLSVVGIQIPENHALGVRSHYFLLQSEIEIEQRKYRFSSVIYRGIGGIQVISRRLGWLAQ
ncbi:MAG: type II secretion system minor pseudopilin GspK [bacterium]